MHKMWLLIIVIIVSIDAYSSDNLNQLIKKNGIEKFENSCCIKYEEITKMKDGDSCIKTVFFDKNKTMYYGTELYYIVSHKIFYQPDRNSLDIKDPESAFEELKKKFNGIKQK